MRVVLCTLSALCVLGAAAWPAAAQADKPLDYAAMNKLGWKLSSQAYTFRELTLLETIDTLHRLGIRYVELFPGQRFSPENPVGFDHNAPAAMVDELVARLKAADVTPVAYGVVGMGSDEASARKVFDFARRLGLVAITTEPAENEVEMLDRLAQEYRIGIAIHNHPQPSHYWNPDTVLKVAQGRSKRIGSCADTGHWYRSGLNPLECLRKLQGRIVSLHFKDLSEDKVDRPWGEGVLDAMGMLSELKRQRFRGVFSIEYESTSGQELVDNVAKCVRFFSDAATKLARGR